MLFSCSPLLELKMTKTNELPVLKWKRPDSVEYPRVWYTFKARDIDSDNLVSYRIQDLPIDRVDDYYRHLHVNYIPDESLARILDYASDPFVYEDYERCWAPIIAQRTALVCFKDGSDEIIGTNLVFINTKVDTYYDDTRKGVSYIKNNNQKKVWK